MRPIIAVCVVQAHPDSRSESRFLRKVRTYVALVAAAYISLHVKAGEDRTYDQYAHESIKSAKTILIKSGKCSDVNDCTRKKYVFFDPVRHGVSLVFYGITEEPIVKQLIAMLAQEFYRLPLGSSLHARFVSTTKEVDLRRSFFKRVPVFAELHMQYGKHEPED